MWVLVEDLISSDKLENAANKALTEGPKVETSEYILTLKEHVIIYDF